MIRSAVNHGCAIAMALLLCWCVHVGGSDFILIDRASGLADGPHRLAEGTLLLKGRWAISLQGNAVCLRSTADGGAGKCGPFVFTNRTRLTIGARPYELLLVASEYAEGYRSGEATRNVRSAIQTALTNDDPRAGLDLIERARSQNPGMCNNREADAAVKELEARQRLAEKMRLAGKVRCGGAWVPAAEVQALQAAREQEAMKSKGLVMHDGKWMTPEAAAAQTRAEAAREAAQRRREVLARCLRCNGAGKVHFEIRPAPVSPGNRMPALRLERPGLPPRDSQFQTETKTCPDCDGSGKRQ
ncbi:MAG: hypothetical protein PHR35_11760 [Kiritimatiellae bacterium]|nr:hypothetical protein [Kiritimatiellia bacterium]